MKGFIELDVPESCIDCIFIHKDTFNSMNCAALNKDAYLKINCEYNYFFSDDYRLYCDTRPDFCPIVIQNKYNPCELCTFEDESYCDSCMYNDFKK